MGMFLAGMGPSVGVTALDVLVRLQHWSMRVLPWVLRRDVPDTDGAQLRRMEKKMKQNYGVPRKWPTCFPLLSYNLISITNTGREKLKKCKAYDFFEKKKKKE